MNDEPDAADPSLLKQSIAKLRGIKRRYVVFFIVAGLAADAAIVFGGLWWIGIFGPNDASAARDALEGCVGGSANVADETTLEACLASIGLATNTADDRGVPDNVDVATRAVNQIQLICRLALSQEALTRCADAPVVEGIIPEVAVRTRVDALLRLRDFARLGEEGGRLIRYGDDFGFLARGLAFHAAEDFALAAADYREAIKSFPDDPVLLDNLARAEVAAPPQ